MAESDPNKDSTDPDVQALAVLWAVVGVLGEEWACYAQAERPPEHLLLAVRAMPGPVLRGVLIEVVAELCRRRGEKRSGGVRG